MSATFEIPHDWEEPTDLTELLNMLREDSSMNTRRIRNAYYFAEQAHSGQVRISGEPYITHPLAVAKILMELHADEDTLCAALMHDVLEDCPAIKREEIAEEFGTTVLNLVEGVTKLGFRQQEAFTERDKRTARSAQAAETLRKMLLAMANDMRVMLIKLADRLHNMRTLDAMTPEKQTRIASETLDIYAPLAARLGIWQVKWQLEDLSFKYLHPKEFKEITDLVSKKREVREAELREAIILLKERLEEKGVRKAEVKGRPKHLFSIWNKIVKHGFKFEEILDLIALRVIVHSKDDCYLALGVIHDLWMPLPQYMNDYIAKPKPNNYQSLHTKVLGPHGEPVEIQIRTQEMHRIAEYGIAAHWAYKESGENQNVVQLQKQLVDWSEEHQVSGDFARSVRSDLLSEQVYVFTPRGDVLELPKLSTPVDFAFRLHTNLGMHLVGAKVNGRIVTLNTVVENGDVVEIITRSNAQPSLDWLEFCKSAHARAKIRSFFRKRNRSENVQRGRDMLERELRSLGVDPKPVLGDDKLDAISKQLPSLESASELLAKVGEGLLSAQSIVNKLLGTTQQQPAVEGPFRINPAREASVLNITEGIDNVMFRRARCCEPLPGDDVSGFVTRGKGIVIHRNTCPNLVSLRLTQAERIQPVDWKPTSGTFSAQIKIVTLNRQGLLMDITTIFGEAKVNVTAAKIRTLPNHTAEIELTIEVKDTEHLAYFMTRIGNFSDVLSVERSQSKAGRNA